MAEADIISALVNLSGTSVLVYILWKLLDKVLDRQAKDSQRMYEALFDIVKENTAAMTTVAVATVVNTDVMNKVKEVINDLPQFVLRVDKRLQYGQDKFDEHGKRLDRLEET